MKAPLRLLQIGLLPSILHLWFAKAHAQLTWITNNGTIEIKGGCPSRPGALVIPETINGLPVTAIGDSAFSGCTKLTSVTIPNSVTGIGGYAFRECTSLTGITIPNSVTSIGDLAFYACSSLASVTIPNSVTSIGGLVFDRCNSLSAIEVDPENPSYSSLNDILFNKVQTALIKCPGLKAGSYSIPNSVTSIEFAAFSQCPSLTSVTIPDSVTSIGGGAFSACTSLTSVTIPNSVTSIGNFTFGRCYSLTNATIPDSVTSIGWAAFSECTSLTSVTIPNSVTSIGRAAFSSCYNLIRMHFQGSAPSIDSDIFERFKVMIIYYLPGTTGWGPTFSGQPTAPWVLPHPVILKTPGNVALQTNGFGFRISWATNSPVVVEATTSLSAPEWSPVSTNTLVDGWVDYRDPAWADHGQRFYRVRGP